MIRYAYVTSLNPPAPFVSVLLQNRTTGVELRAVPAQLDTAADRTLIPLKFAEALSFPQTGMVKIGGVGGISRDMPLYLVLLGVHDFPPVVIEVVADPGEEWILLGRDVINQYPMLLDGPQHALELQQPPAGA